MNVFMTGATGYIGRHLVPELLRRGHVVRALVREGSETKLPRGAIAVRGNALNGATFADQITPSETAPDDCASSRIADGKFPGENRRIDKRRAPHKYGEYLEAVFLKDSFFHGDEERQRCAGNGGVADRQLL